MRRSRFRRPANFWKQNGAAVHIGGFEALTLVGLGVLSGILGALVGIGGGVIIVPVLVLVYGLSIKLAVSTSLVAVVATSTAAGSVWVGKGLANMRLGMTLEVATTIGGLSGGLLAALISPRILAGLFGVMMFVTSALLLRKEPAKKPVESSERSAEPGATDSSERSVKPSEKAEKKSSETSSLARRVEKTSETSSSAPSETSSAPAKTSETSSSEPSDASSAPSETSSPPREPDGHEEPGALAGSFFDVQENQHVTYRAVRIWLGGIVSFGAGLVSGMLGVGGGFIKVPAMHLGMRIPIQVAVATSNFMIGVTAIASLFVYFSRGLVHPAMAAPVALGTVAGSLFGTHLAKRFTAKAIKRLLAGVLILVAIQMLLNGLGVHLGK